MARTFVPADTEWLSRSAAILTVAPLTMACWFNTNAIANQGLVGIADASATSNTFRVYLHSGGSLFFNTRAGGGSSNAEAGAYSTNTWTHACGITASSSSRFCFIDGVKGTENTNANRVPANLDRTAIGNYGESTFVGMDGEIAEVGIWDVALDDAEVAALAAGASPLMIRPGHLVSYTPLVAAPDNDLITGVGWTVNGTPTDAVHPAIFRPSAQILQFPSGGSAALTGTAISGGVLESEIVTGGETIIITLTGDTWVAAGATFDAQRQNIINGLDSAQSEAAGWNVEVRDKEVVGAVVRTSDTVVTVTLTAAAAYVITADETITVTVPATALVTSVSAIVATPTFDVTNETAGRIMSSLVNKGGLAGMGGIAGLGGGLAA